MQHENGALSVSKPPDPDQDNDHPTSAIYDAPAESEASDDVEMLVSVDSDLDEMFENLQVKVKGYSDTD